MVVKISVDDAVPADDCVVDVVGDVVELTGNVVAELVSSFVK